jgi:hypothetical protein
MKARRASMLVVSSLVAPAMIWAAVRPYYWAQWLVHNDAVYYFLGDTGWLGRFITDSAEMIYALSPFPLAILGLILGLSVAFTLRMRPKI